MKLLLLTVFLPLFIFSEEHDSLKVERLSPSNAAHAMGYLLYEITQPAAHKNCFRNESLRKFLATAQVLEKYAHNTYVLFQKPHKVRGVGYYRTTNKKHAVVSLAPPGLFNTVQKRDLLLSKLERKATDCGDREVYIAVPRFTTSAITLGPIRNYKKLPNSDEYSHHYWYVKDLRHKKGPKN